MEINLPKNIPKMIKIEQRIIRALIDKFPDTGIDGIMHIYTEVYNTCYKCHERDVKLSYDSMTRLYLLKCNICGDERCVDIPKSSSNDDADADADEDDEDEDEDSEIEIANKTDRPIKCVLTYTSCKKIVFDTTTHEIKDVVKGKKVLKLITIVNA